MNNLEHGNFFIRVQQIPAATCILLIAIALAVLAGWQFDVDVLKSFVPGAVSMKPNTAFALLLAGLALWVLHSADSSRVRRSLGVAASVLILLIGSLTLLQYAFNGNLGIDELLFRESSNAAFTIHPGRMAPNTALNFILTGGTLLLLHLRLGKRMFLLEFGALFVGVLGLLAIVGYAVGVAQLAGPAEYTKMAIHTAAAFVILSIGLLTAIFTTAGIRFSFEHKVFGGLIIASSFIVFISWLAISDIHTSQEATGWVEHTERVKFNLQELLTLATNVQSGARGYALTGKKEFAKPYFEAVAALENHFSSVLALTQDNPRQQQRLRELKPLLDDRVAFSQQTIETRKRHGLQAAAGLTETGQGVQIMESIHKIVFEMISEEDDLLHERNLVETETADRTRSVIYVGLGAQVLLLGFIFLLIKRETDFRKRTEEALREKTEELDRYFTHTLDLLCIADMDGNFRRLNKAWESTLGYSLRDLEGQPFLDFVHPDDINATVEAMSELSKGKDILSFTNRYRCKDGSYRWIEWRSFPAGKLIYASARDITERRRAEERFRRVVESAPNAIVLANREGKIALVNAQTEKMFGYLREELIGQPIEMLVPERFRDKHLEYRAGFFTNPRTRAMGAGRNLFGLLKDGREIPVEIGLSPVQMEEGLLVLGSITDITERKQAEERIKKLNEDIERHATQLAAANKELEAFSYSVSHDLRAPLRHVGGFVELFQNHAATSLDEKGKRYLSIITDAVRQMGTLIDDLLSFSRMGRAEMHATRVNLNSLVEEVVRGLESEIKGRAVEWHIDPLPEVMGDSSMLRQVVVNLIANALKYSRTRDVTRIEIGTKQDERETVIFVRDNGVGFDMQYADKLFGVFQRLHRADEFEGTGIGLANVHRIIFRHGGRTWAEGKPNGGATFYFSLPATQNGGSS